VRPVEHAVSLVGPDRFELLNQSHALSDHGWDDRDLDKLWRYNLHYFDDLSAPSTTERLAWQRALLRRWVEENPPGTGTGWEPYPTSLRIVNWVKWAFAGHELPEESIESLAVQARWLSRRMEIHLLGNHLFANAKALVFAGLFFDGAEADEWLNAGLGVLAREIPEQILADGGQFERSPMYHAIALEDMLDLYNLVSTSGSAIPVRWRMMRDVLLTRIATMRRWLVAMCHPDGEIAFFNDAALGIAPAPAALEQYAERLGLPSIEPLTPPVTELADSGYCRVDVGPAVAILDVAPVGPDYLPGHAHADTLSFELSLFGHRVLVNSGTSCYGSDAERHRQRGTAAHNTVVVNGVDSSEVWGGFRVARRARADRMVVTREPAVTVRGAHDGYRRLPGRNAHSREWSFGETHVVVSDRVSGDHARAEARFHLHPAIEVEVERQAPDHSACMLRIPSGRRIHVAVTEGRLHVEPATWHPEFGVSVPSTCLAVALVDGRSRIRITWDHPA
jgi:uncharacterized heparinase superfamily protein